MENLKFKDIRQYRTKSVWRLCTSSACRFSVILHRNPLPDTKSACGISVQSAEKSDYASYAQALFSVSYTRKSNTAGEIFPCGIAFLVGEE